MPTLVIFPYHFPLSAFHPPVNSLKTFLKCSFHPSSSAVGMAGQLCLPQVHLARKCLLQMKVDIEDIAREDSRADPAVRGTAGGRMCAPSAASDIRPWLAGRSWGPVGPTALADCSCTHHCFEHQTCPALTLEMSPEEGLPGLHANAGS